MATALADKSLIFQQLLARRQNESLLWNLSGSTFVHIVLILGFGFYISFPEPKPLKHTISINLLPAAELSESSNIGAGKTDARPAAKTSPQAAENKRIVHADQGDDKFDHGAFLVQQQRLLNEINEHNTQNQAAERIGFLGVYEMHPSYRQYQEYWQRYVSQFGTQHYPEVLIEKQLNGDLELDISIDKQGVVRNVEVHRSSGNIDIDNAAIEIAMLASPYAPLPEEMAKEIDVLHIIRTWAFNNHTLVSHP